MTHAYKLGQQVRIPGAQLQGTISSHEDDSHPDAARTRRLGHAGALYTVSGQVTPTEAYEGLHAEEELDPWASPEPRPRPHLRLVPDQAAP